MSSLSSLSPRRASRGFQALSGEVPELPEVETVRRDIARLFSGDTLDGLAVTGRRTVRRHPPEMLSVLQGQALTSVGRHGKYLLLAWTGGKALILHLRMSGQLLVAKVGSPTAAHTHAVLSFAKGGELRFIDPRTFGEMFLAGQGAGGLAVATPASHRSGASSSGSAWELPSELAHLGPDALEVGPVYLASKLAGRRAPLKSLLTDQRVLAGIGNIYADEICFDAGLRPDRAAGSLRRPQVGQLARSTLAVLGAAIEARGSTLGDQQYRDLLGDIGGFQLQHKVYGRASLPCTTCGREIDRVRFGARRAYLCPACQR